MLTDQERAELRLTLLEIQADDERAVAEDAAQHWASVGHGGWRDLLPRSAKR